MGRPAGSKNKAIGTADSLMGVFGYNRVNRCANCRHYEQNGQECHAHAPLPRMVPGEAIQSGESTLWPIVGAADWCGDWVKKEMEVETK